MFDSYNISSRQVNLDIQVDPVLLDIETAIPCGLIVNELVSNALKYAFPGDRTGNIEVRLSPVIDAVAGESPHRFTLVVRDNGIGLPPDFDLAHTRTLGLSLVHGLVAQIRGTIEINGTQGTEFRVTLAGTNV